MLLRRNRARKSVRELQTQKKGRKFHKRSVSPPSKDACLSPNTDRPELSSLRYLKRTTHVIALVCRQSNSLIISYTGFSPVQTISMWMQ